MFRKIVLMKQVSEYLSISNIDLMIFHILNLYMFQ